MTEHDSSVEEQNMEDTDDTRTAEGEQDGQATADAGTGEQAGASSADDTGADETGAAENSAAEEQGIAPHIDVVLVKRVLEGAILASDGPLDRDAMLLLFDENERPTKKGLNEILAMLAEDYADRGIELREVSSGFRFQVRKEMGQWVSRLWQEKPPRYSRAILETLALIAYRQPITRGEIEEIRGVAVNTQIVRTLLERNWVRIVGHRDVPGRPAMYATTRQFLDYFELKSLEDLPPLSEIRDLDKINEELQLEEDKRVAGVLAERAEADNEAAEERRQATIMDAINEPEIDESTLMSLDQVDAVLSGFEAEFRKKPSLEQEEKADADNTTPDMREQDISGEDDNEPTHE